MPRVYLATPDEITERLNTSASGRGETILYENHEWSKQAVGYGTIVGEKRLEKKLCKKCGTELPEDRDDTEIGVYESHGDPSASEHVAEELKSNTNLVINFAHPNNKDFEGITKHSRIGKMLVDWLDDWRNRPL